MTDYYMLCEQNEINRYLADTISKMNGISIGYGQSFYFDHSDDNYNYLKADIYPSNRRYKGRLIIKIPNLDKTGNPFIRLYPLFNFSSNIKVTDIFDDYNVNWYVSWGKKDYALGIIDKKNIIGLRAFVQDLYMREPYTLQPRVDFKVEDNPTTIGRLLTGDERYIAYRYVFQKPEHHVDVDTFGVVNKGYDSVAVVNLAITDVPNLKETLIKYFKDVWGDDYSGAKTGWNLDGVRIIQANYISITGKGNVNHAIHLYFPANGYRPCGALMLYNKSYILSYTNPIRHDFRHSSSVDDDNHSTRIYLGTSAYPEAAKAYLGYKYDVINVLLYKIYRNEARSVIRNGKKRYVLPTASGLHNPRERSYGISSSSGTTSYPVPNKYHTVTRADALAYQYTISMDIFGYDLSKLFREDPIIIHGNKLDKPLVDILTAVGYATGVLFMNQKYGMEIVVEKKEDTGRDYDYYTFTARSSTAAMFFIKDTSFHVKYYTDSN